MVRDRRAKLAHETPSLTDFQHRAAQLQGPARLPVYRAVFADALTPVLAYRRLVRGDHRLAPSFLFESVIDGDRQGRHSFMGARPDAEFIARGQEITFTDHLAGTTKTYHSDNPLREVEQLTGRMPLEPLPGLPAFTGGWVGLVGYDTVRYLEPEKLNAPPPDDRNLPDVHLQRYRDLVAFDHVRKTILLITHVELNPGDKPDTHYTAALRRLDDLEARLAHRPASLAPGQDELPLGAADLTSAPPVLPASNMGEGGYQQAVEQCKQYIAAGDAFQIVPSQRFELKTQADPFDIYRALRVINPSPYMFYLQIKGAILVGSSPEILCRVMDGVATTRPLAGTRHRGRTPEEDAALEAELLADAKDTAEHIMLVDLHRNDIGRVAQPGTIELDKLLAVERYSHVMHISSTVTGQLRPDADRWDALRVSLPVGTVSGAPKVRAMQIIDELEPTRRGPYAGAVGYADFAGNLDMAIALRTMVIQPDAKQWTVHIQAGAGIVADSDPDAEHQETVNKAAALGKAVALAEDALTG